MAIIFASGPVIIEDNRVLLVKDTKDDFWKFCGGRVEDFESDIKLTAAREAREELGLEIEILNEQPFFFYTEKESDGYKISVVLAHFISKRLSDVCSGNETKEWRWLSEEELNQEKLAPNVLAVLQHFGFKK